MAGITLAQAEAKLTLWMQVNDDIASNGQSTAILGRSFVAADLAEVNQQIVFWDGQVKQLSANSTGGIRVRGLTAG
jgi:hypothetical protein